MLPMLRRAFAAHAGELGAAEKFCHAAQVRILRRGQPESVAECVQVVASVHTCLDAFNCSQPNAVRLAAAAGE